MVGIQKGRARLHINDREYILGWGGGGAYMWLRWQGDSLYRILDVRKRSAFRQTKVYFPRVLLEFFIDQQTLLSS